MQVLRFASAGTFPRRITAAPRSAPPGRWLR